MSWGALTNKEGVLISAPGLENATLVLLVATDKNIKNKMLYFSRVRIEPLFINIEVKYHK